MGANRTRGPEVAIDGRNLAPRDDVGKDAYEHPGVRLFSVLIVAIPALAFVAFVYWTGQFFGGFWGGIGSVASTAATVLVLWILKQRRRH